MTVPTKRGPLLISPMLACSAAADGMLHYEKESRLRQLVQSVRDGTIELIEAPRPVVGPTQILVQPSHSLVSAGTERAVHALASASLLKKARARPDLLRQLAQRARADGVLPTWRAAQERLAEYMPLGYSAAGTVVAVGEAVEGIRPGMRVATAGAGHSEVQLVGSLLASPVPDDVSGEEAAFATVASIALQGLRLADVGVGSRICVIGLGLVGQLALRLAGAAGMSALGIDVRPWTVERAKEAGYEAWVEAGEDTTRAIVDWSHGRGVDAVLVTAATASSDPVLRSPMVTRDRGAVVVVGDVGLHFERAPLYAKELTIRVARSYGPGRYERTYEDWGVDYPVGQVRWTEGRNLEAVIDLLSSKRLSVADLITNRYGFDEALDAYRLLDDGNARYLGIELVYDPARRDEPVDRWQGSKSARLVRPSIGLLGAGTFSREVLIPAIRSVELGDLTAVASATGTSAATLAVHAGFARTSGVEDLIEAEDINTVIVATRHDSHAELTKRALLAGKHVFSEKPLALTIEELHGVEAAWRKSGRHLAVGFNRRFSPSICYARDLLNVSSGPLSLVYRVNAGSLPDSHWYLDRRQGGRLLGEVCHFIDACNAVTESEVTDVVARTSHRKELLTDPDLALLLSYSDGSLAVLSYSSGGHRAMPKEHFEILGRGHSIIIDDFRQVGVDGQQGKRGRQQKGHIEEFQVFKGDLATGEGARHTEAMLHSMVVTLAAASSLVDGLPVNVRQFVASGL